LFFFQEKLARKVFLVVGAFLRRTGKTPSEEWFFIFQALAGAVQCAGVSSLAVQQGLSLAPNEICTWFSVYVFRGACLPEVLVSCRSAHPGWDFCSQDVWVFVPETVVSMDQSHMQLFFRNFFGCTFLTAVPFLCFFPLMDFLSQGSPWPPLESVPRVFQSCIFRDPILRVLALRFSPFFR